MPLLKTLTRSELPNTVHTKRLLNKIKALYAQKNTRIEFEKGGHRYLARQCTNVAIDETLANNNIQYQPPGGVAIEYYDLADIRIIKRLRTKKWLICIKDTADSAMV